MKLRVETLQLGRVFDVLFHPFEQPLELGVVAVGHAPRAAIEQFLISWIIPD